MEVGWDEVGVGGGAGLHAAPGCRPVLISRGQPQKQETFNTLAWQPTLLNQIQPPLITNLRHTIIKQEAERRCRRWLAVVIGPRGSCGSCRCSC